ncbi:MAG: hypothetical protein WBC71_06225 [Salaquimonas sp.]
MTYSSFPTARATSLAALLLAGSVLSGCIGGTTYGTGVTQEAQTVQDLSNILSLKRKKNNNIDYSSRPDLVVPEQRQLVEPVDKQDTAQDPNWPETPEQRVARIRAEAEEANGGSLTEQIRFANQEKDFRSTQPKGRLKAAPLGQGVPNISCDPDGIIMRRCTSNEISKAVRAVRKKESGVSDGTVTARRYLTEPPVEYRTPASTAVSGDAGYTEEELAAIKEAEKQKKLDLQNSRF